MDSMARNATPGGTVRQQYDQHAALYEQRSATMQLHSARVLMRRVAAEVKHAELPAGIVLDVGAGTGGATRLLAQQFPGEVVAQDISGEALKIARTKVDGLQVIRSDARSLPLPDGSVKLFYSNSVLHWLNDPPQVTPESALREMRRVAAPDAVLAASVSGVGSAVTFQRAYHDVVAGYAEAELVDLTQYRPDPIGLMTVHELTTQATRAGWSVVRADDVNERPTYASPREYAEDVKAYGFAQYMAPFAEGVREQAWKDLVDHFEELTGPGPYLHEQHMIYVVARANDLRTQEVPAHSIPA